jgi:tetratricopeptide (TPR) repeat protein/DNA-binding XRE family transcriptional regulator
MTLTDEMRAEPIGARLKRLRLERGLSQRELSGPGVSYAYISRIEAGARTPSVKALRMLARKLGVTVEYLETGQDLRDTDERELRIGDAELELRLAENVESAEAKLREILEEAEQAGDRTSSARAQIALGVAAAHRGNHLDAVERLEAALHDHVVLVAARPDLYATLGQSYAALGAPDRAVRLFERCLEEIEATASDDNGTYIRFATYLSYALSDAGDHERAKAVVRDALARDSDGDPYSRVRLYWSLARVVGMEGRSSEALEYMRRAITLLEATDHNVQLARAYLLSAGIEAQEGDADGARDHLRSAKKLLGVHAEPVDRAMLSIGWSRVAALVGDGPKAVERAREAIAVLGDYNGGEQGAAVWALAVGLGTSSDVDGALSTYPRAVDLLAVHGRRSDAARASEEWASLLREHGRGDEADPILKRASDLRAAESLSSRGR